MVDGMSSLVAKAKRIVGTVCLPCVDGKMVQWPSPGSSTATTKSDLVHTDNSDPLNVALGGSIYFKTALRDSTGFVTATPIKTKSMAPDVLKTCIKQLETLTGTKVKHVCHDGAKECHQGPEGMVRGQGHHVRDDGDVQVTAERESGAGEPRADGARLCCSDRCRSRGRAVSCPFGLLRSYFAPVLQGGAGWDAAGGSKGSTPRRCGILRLGESGVRA